MERFESQGNAAMLHELDENSPQGGRALLWNISSIALPLIATLVCFANAIGNGFTNWDDPLYVVENDLITSLSPAHIQGMFSTFLVGNYHPLTVLSLALDYWLYGLNPSGFHAMNVAIHLGNVALVFLATQMLVGNRAVSMVTALLFGIHPLHVESVSWISERKDVLYTLFYLGALCVYLKFLRNEAQAKSYYYATLLLFLCSLLSKGQAVTLPVALLLLDCCKGRALTRGSIAEKIPFFVISVVFGVLAIIAQKDTGAIPDLPELSLVERLICAPFNAALYAAKLVAPIRLSAFYPYPALDGWSSYLLYLVPAACVVALLIVGLRRPRAVIPRDRVVSFGLVFFLLNIVLLLQILPVGASIISERYVYLSSFGFCMLVSYACVRLWQSTVGKCALRWVIASVLAVYTAWLMTVTIERNKVWSGSEVLWSNVLSQFPQATIAYLNRGSYYQVSGDFERALADFNAGLTVAPNHADILANRCDVLRQIGEYERSIVDCTKAIESVSEHTAAYTNRGITYSMLGKRDEALADFEKALALEPRNPKHYSNLGNIYDMSGMYDVAIDQYSRAIALRPDYYAAYFNRAKTKLRKGDLQGAIPDFDISVGSPSLRGDSYFYRSQAYRILGDYEQALRDARAAQQAGREVNPSYLSTLSNK